MSFWTVMSCCFTTPKPETRPCKIITINGVKVRALLDTGSSISLLNSQIRGKVLHKGSNTARAPAIKLCGAGGKELVNAGCYSLQCTLGSKNYWHNFTFIKDLQVPCILGMDILAKANVTIDARQKTITFGQSKPTTFAARTTKKVVLKPYSETQIKLTAPKAFSQGLIESSSSLPDKVVLMDGVISSTSPTECIAVIANFTHLPVSIPTGTLAGKLTIDPNMTCTELTNCLNITTSPPTITNADHVDRIPLTHLPVSYQPKYRQLLREFSDIFSKNDLDLGHCKTLPHPVKLKDPNKVVSINQYRLPHHLKEVAIDYVQKLLAAGVVRKSNSVFNSPLMLVKKPHADPSKPLAEQYRLVHNYVEVNKNISPCSYPLRHLYELLDEVASGKIYSVLDLSQGFFQQHLLDPHQATAFSIPGVGQYSYVRSPQGMNSSPAYFQRLLDFVLTNIQRTYVYIDDVVVSVQSHEENLATLRQVFTRFRKHNLKVKPSKCQFGTAEITYLGYNICSNKGITPGEAKTEVIRNWPTPSSIREIRGFLGLCSFFRRAIKNFSVLSSDLNKLVRKNSGYTKGPLPDAAKQSFLRLQKALISKPCLAAVNFDKEFILTCDASATHYGACLSQKGADNIERPCAYASKLLSEKEAKQAPGFRERASRFCAQAFQPLFSGKRIPYQS